MPPKKYPRYCDCGCNQYFETSVKASNYHRNMNNSNKKVSRPRRATAYATPILNAEPVSHSSSSEPVAKKKKTRKENEHYVKAMNSIKLAIASGKEEGNTTEEMKKHVKLMLKSNTDITSDIHSFNDYVIAVCNEMSNEMTNAYKTNVEQIQDTADEETRDVSMELLKTVNGSDGESRSLIMGNIDQTIANYEYKLAMCKFIKSYAGSVQAHFRLAREVSASLVEEQEAKATQSTPNYDFLKTAPSVRRKKD